MFKRLGNAKGPKNYKHLKNAKMPTQKAKQFFIHGKSVMVHYLKPHNAFYITKV